MKQVFLSPTICTCAGKSEGFLVLLSVLGCVSLMGGCETRAVPISAPFLVASEVVLHLQRRCEINDQSRRTEIITLWRVSTPFWG